MELSSILPTLRFEPGPFEFDGRTGDLRKHRIRIRVPQHASQILVMLLERPGEVVLRPEIRDRLWPDDTVVEFDQRINAAIKRLRSALSDSAGAPGYIETEEKGGLSVYCRSSGSAALSAAALHRWRAGLSAREPQLFRADT